MGTQLDFLSYLDNDTKKNIFARLDDPSDIVRATCVSHSWRDYVIANSLAKHLCLRMFPQLSRVVRVDEIVSMAKSPVAVGSSNMEWETLKKEHRAYAFLARGFMSFPEKSIDTKAYSSNPVFPATVTYKLVADFCVVTEIRVDFWLHCGSAEYFPKSVRFQVGGLSSCIRLPYINNLSDEDLWTYTSQEFPLVREDWLQSFKLPEPVLCIGGILQSELRGMDDSFNTWMPHFEVVGRPLSPAFGVEILEPSGNFVLKALSYTQQRTVPQETRQAAKRLRR